MTTLSVQRHGGCLRRFLSVTLSVVCYQWLVAVVHSLSLPETGITFHRRDAFSISHSAEPSQSSTASIILLYECRRKRSRRTFQTTFLKSSQGYNGQEEEPKALLLLRSSRSTGKSSDEERSLLHALESAGYCHVAIAPSVPVPVPVPADSTAYYCYELSRATGMLKLISSPPKSSGEFVAPRWVPMVRGEENVLVANGWSFLDPDESEPMSAFDIDDANAEAEYRPKWGTNDNRPDASSNQDDAGVLQLSSLGYDLSPLTQEDILLEGDSLSSNPYSRGVLLNGETDPPNTKLTSNGFDFRGSAGQSDISAGIFFTAIGGLPLFSSTDLSPTTGSSDWLSFSRPLAKSHVVHVEPEQDSMDRRIEVVCARTRCHLGHFFGPAEGYYCINASALNFVPSSTEVSTSSRYPLSVASRPISWRPLDDPDEDELPPAHRLLKAVIEQHGNFERVALGCGCFWHVEFALRRLPGVRSTMACYAGGHKTSPTYKDVSKGETGHAEVVSVVYDPEVCPNTVVFDCFLAMHDPTKVRAHGKHALNTGQYRSCIFLSSVALEQTARECLNQCREQLGKELGTDIRLMGQRQSGQQFSSSDFAEEFGGTGCWCWCWRAEDRHQRHDERIKGKLGKLKGFTTTNRSSITLSASKWLDEYGRRTPSILGGSTDLERSLHPDDDGMAMMMI
eukprot:CAMPEP_0172360168 /NCGR_PEP_ID=MMETSP1060-20121228/4244_1 /TAXON_ID=37318 /ORGANISM="Pseudo-nitzschia pungens, Strain cf. cingulata" /LENGTH=678 /DNA_ID=CAMNT_0013082085 /DNA_START=59 /DNA_END=2095 /DNA_ORIENTATION=-